MQAADLREEPGYAGIERFGRLKFLCARVLKWTRVRIEMLGPFRVRLRHRWVDRFSTPKAAKPFDEAARRVLMRALAESGVRVRPPRRTQVYQRPGPSPLRLQNRFAL